MSILAHIVIAGCRIIKDTPNNDGTFKLNHLYPECFKNILSLEYVINHFNSGYCNNYYSVHQRFYNRSHFCNQDLMTIINASLVIMLTKNENAGRVMMAND